MPLRIRLPFLDRRGERPERVLDQDQVGDAARRLAAAAHRDGEVAAFLSERTSFTPSPTIAT